MSVRPFVCGTNSTTDKYKSRARIITEVRCPSVCLGDEQYSGKRQMTREAYHGSKVSVHPPVCLWDKQYNGHSQVSSQAYHGSKVSVRQPVCLWDKQYSTTVLQYKQYNGHRQK